MLDLLSGAFLVIGAITFVVSSIGVLRSEDVYCRTSAIAIAAGLGMACFILALLFQEFTLLNTIKALIAFLIFLAASAVSSIMIARSAYSTDSVLSPKTTIDELAEKI